MEGGGERSLGGQESLPCSLLSIGYAWWGQLWVACLLVCLFFSLCAEGDTKPMDQVGLAVPTAIPSDFPMCFACPPRLAVTFTASGHTGNELRQKAGCGHIVKIPCPSRARRPRWAPELHPALASVLLQSLEGCPPVSRQDCHYVNVCANASLWSDRLLSEVVASKAVTSLSWGPGQGHSTCCFSCSTL